jgi:hypothetical protein
LEKGLRPLFFIFYWERYLMPMFTFHRNYMLRTTKGHAIRFEKDKPTNVPPSCVEDAVAIGARPVEGDAANISEAPETITMTVAERKEKVFEAFRTMKGRNERLDFTGTGIPSTKRLPTLLGFDITSKERDTYWEAFRAGEREVAEQASFDAHTVEAQEVEAKATEEAEVAAMIAAEAKAQAKERTATQAKARAKSATEAAA